MKKINYVLTALVAGLCLSALPVDDEELLAMGKCSRDTEDEQAPSDNREYKKRNGCGCDNTSESDLEGNVAVQEEMEDQD